MQREVTTTYLNTAIIAGMLSIVVVDGVLQGSLHTAGMLFSLGLIFSALMGNFVVNHAEIMESNAPGARLYQSVVNVIPAPAQVKVTE